MPLHVLQLGPYPPPEGGVTRNMIAIRDALAAAEHSSRIIATTKSSRDRDQPNVFFPATPFALLRLLASLKYDILHLHIGGDINARVLALVFAAASFGRAKSVLTFHSGGYPLTQEAQAASRFSIRGFIFRRFSQIIAVSEPIADVFRRYGVEPSRIKVISPFAFHRPDDDVIVPEKLASFFRLHSPLLLAVGGLEKDYDPLFQIAAMADVLTQFSNAGLIIVGDGSMRGDVEDAIRRSGIADRIYLAGNVEHAVTIHLIKGADVMLRTTLFDGDAISVREALCLGTPVIATDNGSRPEGVYLIGAGDSAALVEKLQDAIADGPRGPTAAPAANGIDAVINIYHKLAVRSP